MAVISIINIQAKSGYREQLLRAMVKGIQLTKENRHCQDIRVLLDTENDNLVTFIEYWDNQEAHHQHSERLLEQGVFNEFMPFVEGELESMDYQINSV